jgi:hypothetical protein
VNQRGRWGAALALGWYLGVGFGLPLVDGLLFHDSEAPRTAHVESSDAPCHRGECSLDAPGAPQSPAGDPVALPAVTVVAFAPVLLRSTDVPRGRSPARAHASRAPPSFA